MEVIKFKTVSFYVRVDEVTIERETDKTVWFRQYGKLLSERKTSKYVQIWDTYDEAVAHLMERGRVKIEEAQRRYVNAVSEYDKAVNLMGKKR